MIRTPLVRIVGFSSPGASPPICVYASTYISTCDECAFRVHRNDRRHHIRLTAAGAAHVVDVSMPSSLARQPRRRFASTPLHICSYVCWLVRFASTERPTSPHTPHRSRHYVAKDVMHRAPVSRTCVRLPPLLHRSLPIVDACQSGYGRPVVLAVRAIIYQVVFHLS
jgi:hypothetical protein